MQSILEELVAAGLITKLDGDDTRLEKISAAVGDLAAALGKDRSALLRSALAAINPHVKEDDPAIVTAHDVLVEKWSTMRSVHTSVPVALLRAMLLDACNLAAQDARSAAIVWNILFDQLPLARLGSEAPVVEKMLRSIGERVEGVQQVTPVGSRKKVAAPQPPEITSIAVELPERDLRGDVAAAVTQVHNPHSQQISRVDTAKLADVIGDVAQALSTAVDVSLKRTTEALAATAKYATEANEHQYKATRAELERQAMRDQVRLDALWWYEAMYSPKCKKGYREMPAHIAAVVMVIDLLAIVDSPAPAATAYLLAEAVNRLESSGFDRSYTLKELLETIQETWVEAPLSLNEHMRDAPPTGELSIRDAFVTAISGPDRDVDTILARAGICAEWSGSLPAFARSLYRQEQAERLARDA
ncbi:GTPase-associated system all-helical protein GASH [Burkholderia gladioli]|jgi:hypothetical protein|uniref:GTPase-associated system all-helical protein GASH n=1 Tax=Burkholderia gladioli TaxID=28095 RepID=UPI00163FA3F9|nr:GTPase-associated system all-helical protein GASH [Burkholderia gladioli]